MKVSDNFNDTTVFILHEYKTVRTDFNGVTVTVKRSIVTAAEYCKIVNRKSNHILQYSKMHNIEYPSSITTAPKDNRKMYHTFIIWDRCKLLEGCTDAIKDILNDATTYEMQEIYTRKGKERICYKIIVDTDIYIIYDPFLNRWSKAFYGCNALHTPLYI